MRLSHYQLLRLYQSLDIPQELQFLHCFNSEFSLPLPRQGPGAWKVAGLDLNPCQEGHHQPAAVSPSLWRGTHHEGPTTSLPPDTGPTRHRGHRDSSSGSSITSDDDRFQTLIHVFPPDFNRNCAMQRLVS